MAILERLQWKVQDGNILFSNGVGDDLFQAWLILTSWICNIFFEVLTKNIMKVARSWMEFSAREKAQQINRESAQCLLGLLQ